MGNRSTMTSSLHRTTTYTYDAADQLLSFSTPSLMTFLTWDENGNMVTKGSANYTFDALDHLIQMDSGTDTVQFAYNGDGVRICQTVNGIATDYLQDVGAALPVSWPVNKMARPPGMSMARVSSCRWTLPIQWPTTTAMASAAPAPSATPPASVPTATTTVSLATSRATTATPPSPSASAASSKTTQPA